MLLSKEITLPCGLELPNRLCKAAMAEAMSPSHTPDEKFPKAYGEWADGGWGMILTGNVQVDETYLGSPGDVSILSKASNSPSAATQDLWRNWAATCQRSGTPTIVQLCHPGRQSPWGAGNRSFFAKSVAPSAVKMNLGDNLIAKAATSLLFGTPRELSADEISGPGGIIDQFVAAAKQSFIAGFKGVELHGAHGYLLGQFLSPQTNVRTDEFGGTAAKRAEITVRIIYQIRKETSKEFCIGIKMNSVDASASKSLPDVMEQVRLIVEAGIDFIEISGGTYENSQMMQEPKQPLKDAKKSTVMRESFFLQFAQTVREMFPKVVLMVTGGFRTRQGMEAALECGACDIIGIARPAAVLPRLPKEIILNYSDVSDDDAKVNLTPLKVPFLVSILPIKPLGAGLQSIFYAGQIQKMGKGLKPDECRI